MIKQFQSVTIARKKLSKETYIIIEKSIAFELILHNCYTIDLIERDILF